MNLDDSMISLTLIFFSLVMAIILDGILDHVSHVLKETGLW